jgi:hypothetical protein
MKWNKIIIKVFTFWTDNDLRILHTGIGANERCPSWMLNVNPITKAGIMFPDADIDKCQHAYAALVEQKVSGR